MSQNGSGCRAPHKAAPSAAPGRVWLGAGQPRKEEGIASNRMRIGPLHQFIEHTARPSPPPTPHLSMAGKELGRREAWCLAAGTVLLNALVTLCIVGVALPRAGSHGSAAGAGAGLFAGGAAASGSHSRKLQQVSGSAVAQNVCGEGAACVPCLEQSRLMQGRPLQNKWPMAHGSCSVSPAFLPSARASSHDAVLLLTSRKAGHRTRLDASHVLFGSGQALPRGCCFHSAGASATGSGLLHLLPQTALTCCCTNPHADFC